MLKGQLSRVPWPAGNSWMLFTFLDLTLCCLTAWYTSCKLCKATCDQLICFSDVISFSLAFRCALGHTWMGMAQATRPTSLSSLWSWRESMMHYWSGPLSTRSKKFSLKKKGFRDSLSYSTPQKRKEPRGNAITQPRSHPIKKKCRI